MDWKDSYECLVDASGDFRIVAKTARRNVQTRDSRADAAALGRATSDRANAGLLEAATIDAQREAFWAAQRDISTTG